MSLSPTTRSTGPPGPDPTPGREPRVVVTRPRARASAMVDSLRSRGVDALLLPSIEIVDPEDPEPLEAAARELESYDVVAFTSSAGVRALAAAIDRVGVVIGEPGPRLAAVGPSTARTVREALLRPVDLVPDTDFSGEGLLAAFRDGGLPVAGRTILLPVAEGAADLLPDGLRELGARVRRVTAYRTVPPEAEEVEAVRRAIRRGTVDVLTFTSPSTASNFADMVGPSAFDVPVAAIGSVTAEAARELGFTVPVVAEEQTVSGLVEAVVRDLRDRGVLPGDPLQPEGRST